MAFDFLKKKEHAIIKELCNKCDLLTLENKNLQARIEELSRYQEMVDAEKYIKEKMRDAELEYSRMTTDARRKLSDLKDNITSLEAKYNEGLATYNKLKKQVDVFRDSINSAEYGVYEPHFEFDFSEEYKKKIVDIVDSEKHMIKLGTAISGGENITWNGSLSEGQKMVGRQKKLMLRAFNGECDSFIMNVSWNNFEKMSERIEKSYKAINDVYAKQEIEISERYKKLKLDMLKYTYEMRLKKQEEKDRQREERERIREEEKARREAEAAYNKAKREEETYQAALDKARSEVEGLTGTKMEKMRERIAELEARLAEAVDNGQRALSMAQQTKRGYVYVISNIGSFGDDVYKVGMTRRLDPIERVNELGDASVPFPFDIHAMIFSENAPELEALLHRKLEKTRVNAVNTRKEFFKCSLDDIQSIVLESCPDAEFIRTAEARDYRITDAMRRTENNDKGNYERFPEKLF